MLKDADPNFTGDDTREGLTAIISIKHPDPQFESQTKVKLMNPEVQTLAQQVVGEAFQHLPGRKSFGGAEHCSEMSDLGTRAGCGAQSARPGDPQICSGKPDPAW